MSHDGWSRVRFSDAVEINPKRPISKGTVTPFVEMAALPTYGRTIRFVDARLFQGGGAKFQNGDTLFARITPCAENGKIAFVDCLPERVIAAGSTEFIVFGPRQHLTDPEFIYHLARSEIVRGPALSRMIGTTGRQRVPNTVFDDIEIALPSMFEQRRIADILSSVDEAIQATQAVIDQTRAVKQGVIQRLLSKGIGHTRFKQTEIGEIPATWEVATVGSLLANCDPAMRSGPFGSALKKDELVESGVPFLGIDNIHVERFDHRYKRFVSPAKFEELRRYSVRPLDVAITIMGTVGRCCVIPNGIGRALSSKHIWLMTFDQARYAAELACWQLNFAPWVLRRFTATAQGGIMSAINSTVLRETKFPVPPIREQEQIVDQLRGFQITLDGNEELLRRLTATKTGLMADLFTGRVLTAAADLPMAAE